MKRLIVHFGVHKTGSTFLQAAIHKNRDRLSELGVLVPKAGLHFGLMAHHHLAWEILDDPQFDPSRGGWGDLETEVASSNHELVLITSEAFDRLPRLVKRVKDLSRRTVSWATEPIFVGYVRPQVDFFNSNYTQMVKTFNYKHSFAKYIDRVSRSPRGCDYGVMQSNIYEANCKAIFRPFNKEVLKRGLHVDFLETIGLPRQAMEDIPSIKNARPGPGTIAIIRAVHTVLDACGQNRRFQASQEEKTALRRRVIDAIGALDCDREPFWGGTPDLDVIVEKTFSSSNEQLARNQWGKSWGEVFPKEQGGKAANEIDVHDIPRDEKLATAFCNAILDISDYLKARGK